MTTLALASWLSGCVRLAGWLVADWLGACLLAGWPICWMPCGQLAGVGWSAEWLAWLARLIGWMANGGSWQAGFGRLAVVCCG